MRKRVGIVVVYFYLLNTHVLFIRSRGHGSGCPTALSGMPRCLTPPTSLCRDNTRDINRSLVQLIPIQCPHLNWWHIPRVAILCNIITLVVDTKPAMERSTVKLRNVLPLRSVHQISNGQSVKVASLIFTYKLGTYEYIHLHSHVTMQQMNEGKLTWHQIAVDSSITSITE